MTTETNTDGSFYDEQGRLFDREGNRIYEEQIPENKTYDATGIDDDVKAISFTDPEGNKKSQTTLLIEIGQKYQLFHCPNNDGYAVIGKAVYPMKSKEFKEKLGNDFFNLAGKGCNSKSISDAVSTLEAFAKYKHQEHDVYIRVANLGDAIYLDMGCPNWRVIQVDKDGWKILDQSPVKFVRKRGFAAFPVPIEGGELQTLVKYLNH
jgi:hypothetical protein